MFSQKVRVLILMTFGVLTLCVTTIYGKCNECSTDSFAMCISKDTLRSCPNGRDPTGENIKCPPNQVCTIEQGVCKPEATATADCNGCGDCENGFACISKTEYEYCSGSSMTGMVFKCPNDEYCSLDNFLANKNICVKSCAGNPTCLVDVVTPNPEPQPDYEGTCEALAPTERGYYPNIHDPTCMSYLYCERVNGEMNWIKFSCPEGKYFDKSQKKCTSTKPSYCT